MAAPNDLPKQDTKPRRAHLTSREEGKRGDAKMTFVGSINNIPLCQLNKKNQAIGSLGTLPK